MAKQPTIKPEATYRVELARSIEIAPGIWARPGNEVTLIGADIATHGEAIKSYEEV